jgi:hypothetical protein
MVDLMSGFEMPSQRLEWIRVGFGLSFSGLAELFAVNRTTIYGWLRGDHQIDGLQLGMLERLDVIYDLWQAQPSYFSGLVSSLHQRVEGQTVRCDLSCFEFFWTRVTEK